MIELVCVVRGDFVLFFRYERIVHLISHTVLRTSRVFVVKITRARAQQPPRKSLPLRASERVCSCASVFVFTAQTVVRSAATTIAAPPQLTHGAAPSRSQSVFFICSHRRARSRVK